MGLWFGGDDLETKLQKPKVYKSLKELNLSTSKIKNYRLSSSILRLIFTGNYLCFSDNSLDMLLLL